MSYRNPEIITDRSGEILTQGFSSFSRSIAKGITEAAEIKKAREEANRKRLQEQNALKTRSELNALDKANAFSKELPKTTLNDKITPIITERLLYAEDIKQQLNNEYDPVRRRELLGEISKVNTFLDNTAQGIGKLSEDVTAFAEISPYELNSAYGIAGLDAEQQLNNQGFLTGLSGAANKIDFNTAYDPISNSIIINSDIEVGDKKFKLNNFNLKTYTEGSDLIYPISQLRKDAADTASKIILTDKGEMKPGILNTPQLQIIDQEIIKNGKVVGKRKVQGQIESVNISEINKAINPLVNAEVDSLLNLPDQQKEAILANQYDGLSWNDFANIKDPNERKKALAEVIRPNIITDVLGSDFKQGLIGGNNVYYRETEELKEVKPEKTAGSGKQTKLTAEDKKVIDINQKLAKANEILKWNGIDDFSSPISKSLAKIDFESTVGDELGLTAKPLNMKDPETAENVQIGWAIYNPDLKSFEQEILFEETIPQINKKILRAIGKGWSGLTVPPSSSSDVYSNIQGVTVD